MKGAQFQVLAKGSRPSTASKKASILSRVQQWALRDAGIELFTDQMIPETLVLRFIDLRIEGSHDILSPAHKPVLADTISKDVSAFNEWRKEFCAKHRVFLPDTTLTYAVVQALKFAKDVCVRRKPGRIAPSMTALRDVCRSNIRNPRPLIRQYVLAIQIVCASFLRPLAAASVWYDPKYTALDTRDILMLPPLVMANHSRVLFFTDDDGDRALRLLPTPGTEKNAVRGPPLQGNPEQAKQISTTRFVSNKHFVWPGIVDDIFAALSSLGMSSSGPLLRRFAGHSSSVWTSDDWSDMYRWLEIELVFPPNSLGSAEIRAAHAAALIEAGVPKEYVRMIGFWWSDAARIYEGAAQLPRLRTQKSTGAAWSMPGGPRPQLLHEQVDDMKQGIVRPPGFTVLPVSSSLPISSTSTSCRGTLCW